MKTKLIALMMCGVAASVLAGEQLLSPSRELKLDFSKATSTIEKMARKFTPMAKKMDKTTVGVNEAIAAVKADPNTLNKARFERALAEHMKPVMRNIDTVLESELEMQCAIEDVSAEVKRVALRIRQDYERHEKEIKALKADLSEKAKQLQKLALEVQAEGKKADRKKVMELKKLQQQFKLGDKLLKNRLQVVKQLSGATKTLGSSSENLEVVTDNAQVLFDNLTTNRQAFRDLIRTRMDMANIATMGGDGTGKSLTKMLSKFNKAMNQIDGVGDVLSQIGGSMDSIEMFQQNASFEVAATDGAAVSVTDLTDQILNTDYAYLNE